MDKLERAIQRLLSWQRAETRAGRSRKSRCLEAVRLVLHYEGLLLPRSDKDYAGKLAIDNGKTLAKDPGKWGWQRATRPLPHYVLVYFWDCGQLPDGRKAGHIGILDTQRNIIYANSNLTFSPYWQTRLWRAFVPA